MSINFPVPSKDLGTAWRNGVFVPAKDCVIHMLAPPVQYGYGAFEGMRAYETASGPAIFRWPEHYDRLVASAEAIGIPLPYSADELLDAIRTLFQQNGLKAGYIRPWVGYDAGPLGLNPEGAPITVALFVWPWDNYYGGKALEMVTVDVQRLSPRAFKTDAKVSGHYVNSLRANLAGKARGGTPLMYDLRGHIAESAAANVFFVVEGESGPEIWTPGLWSILPGITRDSIIQIARTLGQTVVERKICRADLELPDGSLRLVEAFSTGTAAEVTAWKSLDGRLIGNGEPGQITLALATYYQAVVCGRAPQFEHWLTRL